MREPKSMIKHILRNLLGNSISDICVEDSIQLVSFDVFDTLIKRKCKKPEDVFRIIGETLGDDSFFYSRISAEKQARKRHEGEITIYDIYDEMSNYDDMKKQELIALEMDKELEVCYPNHEVISVYNSIENDKIILTDMYLPLCHIEKILKKCGVFGYKELFVSCEYGKSKRNGELFETAIKKQAVEASKILHIGDNPLSDFLVPKRKGIKVFLVK